MTSEDIPHFLVFALFASLVTWFAAVRRRVERELLQARDELEIEVAERTQQASLLNLTHDTIFVRDMDDVITYWNRGAQELYGWTPEEAIGKRSHELLHTVFPAPIEDIHAELLRTGRWEGELKQHQSRRNRGGGGQPMVVAARRAGAARCHPGNEQRHHRAQAPGGGNSHASTKNLAKRSTELRPSIRNWRLLPIPYRTTCARRFAIWPAITELLQKNAASVLDEKSQRYMAMILESAKRMGDLIDDLLAFSRIGRAETQKTLVNLEQLVQEALSEVRQETEGRDIVWKIGALPDLLRRPVHAEAGAGQPDFQCGQIHAHARRRPKSRSDATEQKQRRGSGVRSGQWSGLRYEVCE